MIEVPAKIWRPKVVSKYTTPEYYSDDLDSILDYAQYGNCVYKNNLVWADNSDRTDIIKYNDKEHWAELKKDLRMDESIDDATQSSIIKIIQQFWDCFIKIGAKRTILGYEFGIDTGGSKPVCCKKPSYGPYESKVIMEQVTQLLHNNWIKKCGGAWVAWLY